MWKGEGGMVRWRLPRPLRSTDNGLYQAKLAGKNFWYLTKTAHLTGVMPMLRSRAGARSNKARGCIPFTTPCAGRSWNRPCGRA